MVGINGIGPRFPVFAGPMGPGIQQDAVVDTQMALLQQWGLVGDQFQMGGGQNMGGLPFPPAMMLDPSMMMGMLLNFLMQQLQQSGQFGCGTYRGTMPGGGFSHMRQAPGWGGPGGHRGVAGPTNANVNLPNMPTGNGTAGNFLQHALAQQGDRYVFGAETNLNDANPDTFDCSELVQWAAARAGVNIPDGSANQEAWVRRHGTQMSVEQALRTPGALLFRRGHVAISLGDGRTIEAKGSRHGVGVFNGRGRFTSAGLVPGMRYN